MTKKIFVLHDEDHTMGNALRAILLTDPSVEFVGYSVPDPSIRSIQLTLKTNDVKPPEQALLDAVAHLEGIAQSLLYQIDHRVHM